jgi:hypothetical protein
LRAGRTAGTDSGCGQIATADRSQGVHGVGVHIGFLLDATVENVSMTVDA